MRASTSRLPAWLLLAAAAAAGIAGTVVLATGTGEPISGFQRISFAAGHRSVPLDAGHWVGYYESGALTRSDRTVPDFRPLIRDPRGEQINVENYVARGGAPTGLSYDQGGHRGIAVFEFDAPRAGSFDVRLQFAGAMPPGADVAIGRDVSVGSGTPRSGVVLVVAGGLLLVAAVLLLVRNRRRRAHTVVSGGA